MTTSAQLSLLTRLAQYAPAPLPEPCLDLLLTELETADVGQSHLHQALLTALVSRADVPESQALALTLRYRTHGSALTAFLTRAGVSSAGVDAALACEQRVTVLRELASNRRLDARAYEVLAARSDRNLRLNLLRNSVTTPELAVLLWRGGSPGGLRRAACRAGFGSLGQDALHAVLTCEPLSWDLGEEALSNWPRLSRASQEHVVDAVAQRLSVPGIAAHNRDVIHALMRAVGDDDALLGVVQHHLSDPDTALGALARPRAGKLAWLDMLAVGATGAARALPTWTGGLGQQIAHTCGQDLDRWRLLLALADNFTGSAADLLAVVAGVSDSPTSASAGESGPPPAAVG